MKPAAASSPTHVAIIMDGNGRWAKKRGLPRIEGHRRGVETVRTILQAAKETGVRYLTLYAFSAENWKRPAAEVNALMLLLQSFLRKETKELVAQQIRLHTIGRTQELPAPVRKELERALQATAHFTERHLVLALNYGARTEVVDAAAAYAREVAAGREDPAQCSFEKLARHLYTAGLPDPDLVIRTSGETRISNFLLLQAAYSEFLFTPVLWPDFSADDFRAALADFAGRERRFGATGDQLKSPS
ncbi:MAG TPA: isoprenyl transferase [Opitutaceae bacterium]|nr:isoprenyl transferase [Opitutaceae bacterium]